MILLCLDLGRITGVAYGEATPTSRPEVFHWNLGAGADAGEQYASTLGYLLRKHFKENPRPDRIVVEEPMRSAASRSGSATEGQHQLYGAVLGLGGATRIRVSAVPVATARKHFCGRATAQARLPRGMSPKEKAEARKANKDMVLTRAKMLGYLPQDCKNDNMADACAVWSWAVMTFVRQRQIEERLALFT